MPMLSPTPCSKLKPLLFEKALKEKIEASVLKLLNNIC